MKLKSLFLFIAAYLLFFTVAAAAKDDPEYTQIGRTITIDAQQQVGDVTCIGCSIYIRGRVSGDVTTVGGSIYLQDHGQIAGEVTAVAGNLRLDADTKIGGDATVVGGEMSRITGSEVGGDVTHLGGYGWIWLLLIVAVPLGVLFGLVMLIVFVVRRLAPSRVPVTA